MSRYIINQNFRHHKKGDIIEKYEYNRLPIEVKERCKEEVIEQPVSKPEPVVVESTVVTEPEPEVRSNRFKKVSE